MPDKWHWPVGVSLSTEFGYERPIFSVDTWTWEIRPIVDKQWKSWYLAFNPALERSWHGPGVKDGMVFAPSFKAAYSLTRKLSAGLEYYGSLGPIPDFYPSRSSSRTSSPPSTMISVPTGNLTSALVWASRRTPIISW